MLNAVLVAALGALSFGCTPLTEKEAEICRSRAADQRNDFSARQVYAICAKTIRKELIDAEASERQRATEEASKEKRRVKLVNELVGEMVARCESVRKEWASLQADRKQNYQKYSEQSPLFWEAVKQKYGPDTQGKTTSEYPLADRKEFPWVYWYGELMKREEALIDVVMPPGDSRLVPKDHRFLESAGMDSCSPNDLSSQVKN